MTTPSVVKQAELGYRALRSIRQIIHNVSSHSRTLSKESGLTVPQLLCLRAIEVAGPGALNVAGLAETVHISRPTVSGIIDRLVRAGLIERVRDPDDRRKVRLSLTDVGEARVQDTPMPLQDRFLRRLARLGEDEQERLLSALEQLVGMMVDDEDSGTP